MMPPIPANAPAVLTAKGPLRPERAILYDKPFLLLWHFDPVRSGHQLDEAQLAGLRKTAQRLDQLLRPFGSSRLLPIAWPQPEVVLFRLAPSDDTSARDIFTAITRKLVQNESAWFVEPLDAIEYRRC